MVRYVWGEPSPYSVALSLRPGAYLSHASAIYVHGLSDQIPKTIYVNKEQTPKPAPTGALSQAAIDKAFQNKPRMSQYVFGLGDHRIVVLSGKNTKRLEVSQVEVASGEWVDATKLERTLIDIAVRPVYAGGTQEVLTAYRAARERMSVPVLLATLKKLAHVYPYHQAIGFYMQTAGYPSADYERLRSLGLGFDFYLTNRIPNARYSKEWRLFYPEGL